MAITWNNVSGVSDRAGGQILNNSVATINRGGQQIIDTLGNMEDTQNAEQSLAFKELLASARTPEQLEALRPQLDAMRENMTPGARMGLVGAGDARLQTINANNLSKLQTANAVGVENQRVADKEQAPYMNAIFSADMGNRPEESARLVQEFNKKFPGNNKNQIIAKSALDLRNLRATNAAAAAKNTREERKLRIEEKTAKNVAETAAKDRHYKNEDAVFEHNKIQADSTANIDTLGLYINESVFPDDEGRQGGALKNLAGALTKFPPNTFTNQEVQTILAKYRGTGDYGGDDGFWSFKSNALKDRGNNEVSGKPIGILEDLLALADTTAHKRKVESRNLKSEQLLGRVAASRTELNLPPPTLPPEIGSDFDKKRNQTTGQ